MARAYGHSSATKFYAAVALCVGAVVIAILIRRPKFSHAAPGREGTSDVIAWCATGLDPISGGGCLALPSAAGQGTPLLIYLHGRYAPNASADELDRQQRVAKLGTSRGFAVLALRGAQNQCSDPLLASWWCWPSNERNADTGPAFVERWQPALDVVNEQLGSGPRYLLGFSNGGYFATLIATRALFPFDAVTVAHAGPVQPTRAVGNKVPMLLITADEDASNDEMIRLSGELAREKWPAQIVAREGGHSLPDWDIEMALTFFVRSRSEKVPLDPPLSTRAPKRSEVDAAVVENDPAPKTAPEPESTPDAGAIDDAGSTPNDPSSN
ncbi:hypothetical protein AKJ09_07306 [Labilithrix luteola]|uniref:Esterase n=1 Tax=Labilithrix luteola TaxID=1391654 RepID=A0A0K1Q4H9_9BACT|nr:hypothetical protein [Labilithrix luteola]AKV00643.1 hypothetical protein AKJ09_07306 [Labilithrix luteola]